MPTLTPAPDRVSPSPAAPPAGPGARRLARERTARRGRILGMLVTVGAHLLLFLVLRSAAVEPDLGGRPAQATPEPPAGMRVVQVTEPPPGDVPVEPAPRERQRAPLARAPRAAPAPPPAMPPARTDERAPAPPVGADRIGAGPRDPRLWRLPETVRPVDLTSEDIRRIELLAALSQLGDSLAYAQLAEMARFDWTVKDDEGGRWGVTPGWLHLGGISIPLPLNFGTPTLGTGAEGRAADWAAIQEQARRLGTDAELQARIRALRERKAAEREKGRSGNDGP